jgi:hypothetical protein
MYSLFGKKSKVLSSTPPQESNNIAKIKANYGKMSVNATGERAQASALTTVTATGYAAYWTAVGGLSAAQLASASAVGVSMAIPGLAPASLGVIVACIFVMRQRGLNKELLSNLYFIKMEVERMSRVHNVIKVIAKEKHINLNTASLAFCMVSLQKKILQFADKKTTHDIEQLEKFLQNDNLTEAKILTTQADKAADIQMKIVSESVLTQEGAAAKSGGGWFTAGWASRWLSPDETLRQIIRDITIATVWFSIMLGEFDIFNKYNQLITPEATSNVWITSHAMEELLVANKQLGLTTAVNKSNDPDFDIFYNIKDLKEATGAIGLSLSVHEAEKETSARERTSSSSSSSSDPGMGGRRTRKHRQ